MSLVKATCPKCQSRTQVSYGWYSEDFTAVPEFYCHTCGHGEQKRLGEYEPIEQRQEKVARLEARWQYEKESKS